MEVEWRRGLPSIWTHWEALKDASIATPRCKSPTEEDGCMNMCMDRNLTRQNVSTIEVSEASQTVRLSENKEL